MNGPKIPGQVSLSNEILLVRRYLGQKLAACEIMDLASQVGLKNRRYIKLHPEIFERMLDKVIAAFEDTNGPLLNALPIDSLQYGKSIVFANLSLPDNVRQLDVPRLLSDERFRSMLRTLLEQAHEGVKKELRRKKKQVEES